MLCFLCIGEIIEEKKEICIVCYKWAIRHCKYLPVLVDELLLLFNVGTWPMFCIPPGSLGVITVRLEFSPELVPLVGSNIAGVVLGLLPLLVVSTTCVDTSEGFFELFSVMTWVVANISVVCDDITPEVVVEGGYVRLTSSHVTLTSSFPPAGKTKYVY